MTTASTPSDTAPPYAFAWATLACVLAALTLAHPALGGAFLVNPVSDQYIAGYPFREFAAASLRAGEGIPQWNPYLMGGMPYIAAMHGDIFYPTFLLRMILPTDVAMTWGMILHLMLAGVAGYAFLRAIGVSFAAALVGGIAYMMSGQVASLVSPGHDGKLFVSALLPVTMLVLTWGIRDGRRFAWGLLAIIVGLGVLSPHPQLLQYLLLASGAWALMLAFGGVGATAAGGTGGRGGSDGSVLPRGEAVKRLGFALAAVALGMLMGAVQYLPVMEYVDWSPRAGGRDYSYATSFSMPIEELFNTYLPQFTGILDNYWGRNGIHFHSEYIGAGVLFLAAASFLRGTSDASRRKLLWFFTGLLVVSMLWALGGNTPFYRIVYALVPGSKYFRAPSTIFFLTTFAAAVLAAFGTERLLKAEIPRLWLGVGAGIGAGIALLATVGVFQQMAMTIALPQQVDSVDANTSAVVMGAWRSLLFLGATIAIAYGVGTRKLTPTLAGWLLAAVTVADLWSIERLYWKFMPPANVIYASDPAIEHIKAESEPVRVATLPFDNGAVYHDPNLALDGLMVHGVRIVTGYHGNELGRYQLLKGSDQGYRQMGNPTFWGLMNIKYLYTNVADLGLEGAKTPVGPIRTAAGTQVWLHELPGEHPFAWVAPVIAKFTDEQVLEALRVPTFPYQSVALLPNESSTPAVPLTSLPQPTGIKTRTTGYKPGAFTVELETPAPSGSALVVSENFYPGWTAVVDGQPATAERADLSLMAVALPEGARKVEFRFDSPPYHTGRGITLAVLGLALAMLGAGAVVDRKKGTAAAAEPANA
ncbi:MAG: hypothetical protein KF709_14785 [Gemmatimonadaceae bacterium]|nr:hypothetical protein [Gemmatimonadaceae bacterium]